MNLILNFISTKFSYVMVTAIILGISIESLSGLVKPYTMYPLMVAIYLGFIKIDLETIKDELKNPFRQLYILIFTSFLLPIALWCIMSIIVKLFNTDPQFATSVLLLYASPTAALAPALCMLLKANLERATISMIVSTLLVPFTLPVLLGVFTSDSNQIDFETIAISLFKLVSFPFIAAVISRTFLTKPTNLIKPFVAPFSVIMIFFVIIGCVHGMKPQILGNIQTVLFCLLISYCTLITAFTIGWFSAWGGSKKDRFTLAILAAWPNIGITILIASNHLASAFPLILLFMIASEIPWSTSFVFAQKFAKKINQME